MPAKKKTAKRAHHKPMRAKVRPLRDIHLSVMIDEDMRERLTSTDTPGETISTRAYRLILLGLDSESQDD